jgi:ribosome-associated heat shock protein Hsp15
VSVVESVRVDKWIWAVRCFPTRSAAAAACQGGHVRVDGSSAKPATSVRIGSQVVITGHGAERILEAVTLIDKRVGAPIAATCYIDHSPPPPEPEMVAPFLQRDRSTGRPTKKDRRTIDKFRNR